MILINDCMIIPKFVRCLRRRILALVGAHSIFSLRFAGIVTSTKFNQLSRFFSKTFERKQLQGID